MMYDTKQILTEKYKDNCLNTIRLITALSILYSHVCDTLDISMPSIINNIVRYFHVTIFFTISGYLVWYSAKNSDGFIYYLKKRFLRIYPELWAAVIIEIIVLVIMLKGAVDWPMLMLFSLTQSTILQFWTPDFLRAYGCGTPNGALWTICLMVQFYIIVYPMAKIMRKASTKIWLCLMSASILVAAGNSIIEGVLPEIIYKLYRRTLIPYVWFFIIGAFICEKKDVLLPYLKKIWPILLIASAVFQLTGFDITLSYPFFRCSTLVVGIIGFAYAFPTLNIKMDITNGIYLYHMTITNVILQLGYSESRVLLIFITAITCLLSYLSTVTIGKWAQNKKKMIKISEEAKATKAEG